MIQDDILRIERALDHTLLKPDMTAADLEAFCSDVLSSEVAAVCIPPSWVPEAKDILKDTKPICTVIGFPNGYQSTVAKLAEATDALEAGAGELDVVVHIGRIRSGQYDALQREFLALRRIDENMVLKAILETGALSLNEIKQSILHLNETGIDYYKTSTGFNFSGASLEAVDCMRSHKSPEIKIKASGGIRDLETALAYLEAGVDRIGSSGLLQLCRMKREGING